MSRRIALVNWCHLCSAALIALMLPGRAVSSLTASAMQVTEAKQHHAQELQHAREELQLHRQLLQQQDEEVCKLRKLLEVQHEQMVAQEQQQSQDLTRMQDCIRQQQQHAAELQQTAARQEAEGLCLFVCDFHIFHFQEDQKGQRSVACNGTFNSQECNAVKLYTCIFILSPMESCSAQK